MKDIHISVVLMVKNEQHHILKSLESIKDVAKSVILYDTGSTDKTISEAEKWCEENDLAFHCLMGTFVNFEVSRNIALDFADSFEENEFLLLLDASDELRNGNELVEFLKTQPLEQECWYIRQEWFTGTYTNNDTYYNTRVFRPRCGWRYIGAVHEYLNRTPGPQPPILRMPNTICLYQDRTREGGQSFRRYERDRDLLLEDLKRERNVPRTLFYLAQTCTCMGHIDEAIQYYTDRLKYEIFPEEEYHSTFRLGEIFYNKGRKDLAKNFWSLAFEKYHRAEPLVKLAQMFREYDNWLVAYMYIRTACELEYPTECVLFVNRYDYTFTRWFLMGIIAFYVGRMEEGEKACRIALEENSNCEWSRKNLECYVNAKIVNSS
jgi:glycosyltransferase involved in cell wall biosynthesis